MALRINDLPMAEELDRKTMAATRGGYYLFPSYGPVLVGGPGGNGTGGNGVGGNNNNGGNNNDGGNSGNGGGNGVGGNGTGGNGGNVGFPWF
jgi:hypothetical protein